MPYNLSPSKIGSLYNPWSISPKYFLCVFARRDSFSIHLFAASSAPTAFLMRSLTGELTHAGSLLSLTQHRMLALHVLCPGTPLLTRSWVMQLLLEHP